jgi:hypothetical protein
MAFFAEDVHCLARYSLLVNKMPQTYFFCCSVGHLYPCFLLVCALKWTTKWLSGLPIRGIQLLVLHNFTLLLASNYHICFRLSQHKPPLPPLSLKE